MRTQKFWGLILAVLLVALGGSVVAKARLSDEAVAPSAQTEPSPDARPSAPTLPGARSLAANLIAWYEFEGDASDSSGSGYDGVANGATTTAGKYGQAYQFDGVDDTISVAWDAPIQGDDQSFTLAAWVKTDDVSGEHWVLADDSGWHHFLFGLHQGHLYVWWRYGDLWTDYTLDTFQTVAGGFTHVAATYDASTRYVRLYVNGALSVADTTSLPLGVRDFSALHVGVGRSAADSEYFDGVIDDVRIYDGALTDEEIRALADDAVVPLLLRADPVSQTVHLSWAVNAALSPTGTWQIAYDGPAGDEPSPITGIVSATRAYTLTGLTNDVAYTATLSAMAGSTSSFSETVNVMPTDALPHPRLFFYGQDVLALREAGRTTHAEIRQPILRYATSLLGSPPPAYPGGPDYGAFREAGYRLIPLAFAYVVTGEERFSDLTREYLLEYATNWEYWGWDNIQDDRDETLAFMLRGYALAYDWVYDQLSESERATVRDALAAHAYKMYEASSGPYTSAWRNWWWRSYAQNHWHTNNSVLGMAALALEGEDVRATTWVDHVVDQMEINTYLLQGIGDGTWHEGIYYQVGMFSALPFYHNLNRLKGQDIFPDAYFQNYVLSKLYNYLPGTSQYVLGYSSFFENWGWDAPVHEHVLRFMAGRYHSGYAAWLAQELVEAEGRYSSMYRTPQYVYEFLSYDPTVTPTAPAGMPLDHTFPDLEGVVWRTGWGADDVVFGLRTGPYGGRFLYETYLDDAYPFDVTGDELNVGHNQPDANTFYLFRGGTELAGELIVRARAGTTQFHNTLLVDEEDQYFANWHNRIYEDTDAGLEAVYGTPNFSYLASDATDRYREQNLDGPGSPGDWMVSEFTRHVLFAKPNYLVMVDNVRSDTAHQYDWVCHVRDGGSITVEGNWVKGAAGGTEPDVLGINVLAPAGFAHALGVSTHQYTSFEKPYIRVRPSTDVADTRFVTVLYPTDQASWSSKPATSLLGDTGQAAGVRVALNGTQDHLVKYGTAEQVAIDEYELTGQVASIYKDGAGDLTRLFLGNGRVVSDGGGTRELIRAQTAITVEAVYSGTALALYGDGLDGLKLYGPDVDVGQVTINDQEAVAVKIGDYVYVFSETEVALRGTPGDSRIYLTWDVYGDLLAETFWHIDYYTQTMTVPLTETSIVSTTRAYTLTDLSNGAWYTVTLHAMVDSAPWLSDTVRVMPTNKFVYLPLVLRAY